MLTPKENATALSLEFLAMFVFKYTFPLIFFAQDGPACANDEECNSEVTWNFSMSNYSAKTESNPTWNESSPPTTPSSPPPSQSQPTKPSALLS